MFKKLLLALALVIWACPAQAQNPTCPTRPVGDNTNSCASTAFVQQNVGFLAGVTSIGGMTGVITCGSGLTCSGGTITATGAVALPLPHTQILVGNASNVATPYFSGSGNTVVTANFSDVGTLTIVPNVSLAPPGLFINRSNALTAPPGLGHSDLLATLVASDAQVARLGLLSGEDWSEIDLVQAPTSTLTPTPTQSGRLVGTLAGYGFGTTKYMAFGGASLNFVPTENWTDASAGMQILFKTTPNGAATQANAAAISNSGGLSIGSANVATDPGSGNIRSTGLTLAGITGSTQCLQINTTGVVSGSGAPCLPSGGVITSTGNTLVVSGTTNLEINLAHANTWTANQVFNNGLTSNAITLSSAIGSTQCLHANSTGVITGTGVECAGGGVTGVTSTDSTLIISPTTGAVVAGINLANQNTWTATQNYSVNANARVVNSISNTSGGVSALVGWQATNGVDLVQFGMAGTAFSDPPAILKGRSVIHSTNDFIIGVDTTHSILFSINNIEYGRWNGNSPVELDLGATGGTTAGALRFYASGSGSVFIRTQSNTGSPILTLPNTSGTFAVNASAPLVLDAVTGQLTCPTCGGTGAINDITSLGGTILVNKTTTTTTVVNVDIALNNPNTWAAQQTFASLKLANVSGSPFTCLHANSSGVVSGTGTDCGSGSGNTGSVSNTDLTLTIAPTTGNVIASLNLAHANIWTASQSFNAGMSASAISTSALTIVGASGCLQAAAGVVTGTGTACGSGGGAVSSVSNSDSTLTIAPTTGAVVAGLNIAHANTWTASQNLVINQNSPTQNVVQNNDAGTAALAMWTASNGVNSLNFGQAGAGYTGIPILTGRAFLLTSGAVPFVLNSGGASPIIVGISNSEVARYTSTGMSIQPTGQGIAPDAPLTINANTVGNLVGGATGTDLHIIGGNDLPARLLVDSFASSTNAGFSLINGRGAGGTAATKTATQNSQWLLTLAGSGYNGSYFDVAYMAIAAAETFTSAAGGSRFSFYTETLGSVGGPAEVMRIQPSGGLSVGSANVGNDQGNGVITATNVKAFSNAVPLSSNHGQFEASASATQWLTLGYDGVADVGHIQAVHAGVAVTQLNLNPNGGAVTINSLPVPVVVSSGSGTLGPQTIASGVCSNVPAVNTGVLATDTIAASFGNDPATAVGFQPSASGMLSILPFPSANTINWKICNNTAASITMGSITINWKVLR